MPPVAVAVGVAAVSAYSSYKKGKDAKKNAQRAQDAANRQSADARYYASPEYWTENYNRYQQEFKKAYRPWLVGEQDRAALAEQDMMQAYGTDLGRRDLSGAGLAIAGRSAIRGGRQAQISTNLRHYKQAWEGAARDAADKTSARGINASIGAPYQAVPQISSGSITRTLYSQASVLMPLTGP